MGTEKQPSKETPKSATRKVLETAAVAVLAAGMSWAPAPATAATPAAAAVETSQDVSVEDLIEILSASPGDGDGSQWREDCDDCDRCDKTPVCPTGVRG